MIGLELVTLGLLDLGLWSEILSGGGRGEVREGFSAVATALILSALDWAFEKSGVGEFAKTRMVLACCFASCEISVIFCWALVSLDWFSAG